MIVPLPTLRATRALAARLSKGLTGGELILLSGELGSGKTTFVRYLTETLGVPPGWVSSPSFTLIQRYPPGDTGFGVVHVDLYRLKGPAELEGLGLEEILDSKDLVVVEWPEAGEMLWASCRRPLTRIAFGSGPAGRREAVVTAGD